MLFMVASVVIVWGNVMFVMSFVEIAPLRGARILMQRPGLSVTTCFLVVSVVSEPGLVMLVRCFIDGALLRGARFVHWTRFVAVARSVVDGPPLRGASFSFK